MRTIFFILSVVFFSHFLDGSEKIQNNPKAPQAVGQIPTQSIVQPIPGINSILLDVSPYFDGHGEPLAYSLGTVNLTGEVSNFEVTLNPFNGVLHVPSSWLIFAPTTVTIDILVKNTYGIAHQPLTIYLSNSGG